MKLNFSIIIPVYNRPEELGELLKSICDQYITDDFEVVVVEDGSKVLSNKIVGSFEKLLNIKYYQKENSGPGDSRNFGMKKALGNYFIFLDSDCILPENYLQEIQTVLEIKYTDAFGGADAAHASFTTIQKAINYSMTSFLTTGGIRGGEKENSKFQLRSFNMGISKKAFLKTGGFSKQYLGEDIDLTFKLWDANFDTQFISEAFVYHKRRTSWKQFFQQIFNFGAARPVLNKMHPDLAKITFWFPSLFIMGLFFAVLFSYFGFNVLLILYGVYLTAIFLDAINKNRCYGETWLISIQTGVFSIFATLLQFIGYGSGFLRSIFRLYILNRSVKDTLPNMFEKKN